MYGTVWSKNSKIEVIEKDFWLKKPTRSRSSLGTVSSFETFPWNFFDKYERTSLSQFCKYTFQLLCMPLDKNPNNMVATANYPLYLFGGNVKIWLKREGNLENT